MTEPLDPTDNTRLIVDAAIKHINDLRGSEDQRLREGLFAEQRRVDGVMQAERRRVDEHMKAESRRIDEQMALRADFAAQLNVAEAKRIDAIRAVDVNAVSVANERATAQAAVLANQVAASAETLRSLVAATAATVAQQLAQMSAQFTDRLSSLEKSQYESKGTAGGVKDMTGWFVGGLVALIGIAMSVWANLK